MSYALMLMQNADLVAVYESEEAARAAQEKIVEADRSLTDLEIVELDADGRPVHLSRHAAVA